MLKAQLTVSELLVKRAQVLTTTTKKFDLCKIEVKGCANDLSSMFFKKTLVFSF